jgi:hypothetical protein
MATDDRSVPAYVRRILWIDCIGALTVGTAMVVFAAWIEPLFRLPEPLYPIVAAANLGYGAFSLFLASRRKRSVRLIVILAGANALWGVVSLGFAAVAAGHASGFGLGHLVAEAGVVFALARFEWRHRAALAAEQAGTAPGRDPADRHR